MCVERTAPSTELGLRYDGVESFHGVRGSPGVGRPRKQFAKGEMSLAYAYNSHRVVYSYNTCRDASSFNLHGWVGRRVRS